MPVTDADLKKPLPHKEAFFSLIPVNPKAHNVVDAEDNEHLVSYTWEEGLKSFDIGFHINSQYSTNTLVTLGRDNCDIRLKPKTISKFQCSFEVDDLDTGIVMLYDRSHGIKTKVSGTENSIAHPFEVGRLPRKILVHPQCNDEISMGGVKGDLIQFRLEWLLDEDEMRDVARRHRDASKGSVTNPRKARTRDLTDTILPSVQMTPDQAFTKPSQLKIRYLSQTLVGVGSYGKVKRVIGIDTGRVMAMKEFHCVSQAQQLEHVAQVEREVELMRLAKHVSLQALSFLCDDAYYGQAKHCRLDHVPGLG